MENSANRGGAVCLSVILLLACFSGCSKEAAFSTEGLQTNERFVSDTLYAIDSDWSNRGRSAGDMWRSTRLVVCNWQGYLSRSFLKFSSLPDSTAEITSAALYLYATRVDASLGGSGFELFTLTDTLDQMSIFWGSMPEHGNGDGVPFDPPADSNDSVTVDVTGIVSSWVKNEQPNLGLVILSDEIIEESGIIVEFASREVPVKETISDDDTTTLDFRPALRIAYMDTAGESQYMQSVASQDVFADTLIVPFPGDTLGLLCGNGFPTRTLIRFDFSALPVEATVTRSKLMLTPNLDESSFDSMTVICHAILSPGWVGFDTKIGLSGSGYQELLRESLTPGETVDMVITPLIQPLVSRRQTSYGLVIKSAGENADLDFIRFFSSRVAEADKLPTLEIDYVLPPDPWYRESQ